MTTASGGRRRRADTRRARVVARRAAAAARLAAAARRLRRNHLAARARHHARAVAERVPACARDPWIGIELRAAFARRPRTVLVVARRQIEARLFFEPRDAIRERAIRIGTVAAARPARQHSDRAP